MPSFPEAIVLFGGAGLQLEDVIGTNLKSMAAVVSWAFLDLLPNQLRRYRFERAILGIGYQQETIRFYFGETFGGLRRVYSSVSTPRGTGGALAIARALVESDVVLTMMVTAMRTLI